MSDNDSESEQSTADHEPSAAETPVAGSGGAVPVGVKLGSTRTVVAFPTAGGAELEVVRTLTCLASYEDALTGETRYLYGEDAAREYPDRVEYMLRSGLPEDKDRAGLTA